MEVWLGGEVGWNYLRLGREMVTLESALIIIFFSIFLHCSGFLIPSPGIIWIQARISTINTTISL